MHEFTFENCTLVLFAPGKPEIVKKSVEILFRDGRIDFTDYMIGEAPASIEAGQQVSGSRDHTYYHSLEGRPRLASRNEIDCIDDALREHGKDLLLRAGTDLSRGLLLNAASDIIVALAQNPDNEERAFCLVGNPGVLNAVLFQISQKEQRPWLEDLALKHLIRPGKFLKVWYKKNGEVTNFGWTFNH